jgi:hypothetical protein
MKITMMAKCRTEGPPRAEGMQTRKEKAKPASNKTQNPAIRGHARVARGYPGKITDIIRGSLRQPYQHCLS